jgi:hypothetical protein
MRLAFAEADLGPAEYSGSGHSAAGVTVADAHHAVAGVVVGEAVDAVLHAARPGRGTAAGPPGQRGGEAGDVRVATGVGEQRDNPDPGRTSEGAKGR